MATTAEERAERDPRVPESALSADLYRQSRAADYGITPAQFTAILLDVARQYLPELVGAAERESFYRALHVEDLALARACAQGHEGAWREFVARFDNKLQAFARSLTRDSSARELAASLYGDLFGMRTRGDERVSKLNSYRGRGSLEGWLRTVLAQMHVDRLRADKKTVSLDEMQPDVADVKSQGVSPELDPRVQPAIVRALVTLTAEDRWILASYYLDQRKLRDIAGELGIHESTASRKLERAINSARKGLQRELKRSGMSPRHIEEAVAADSRELSVDFTRILRQDRRPVPFSLEGDHETKS